MSNLKQTVGKFLGKQLTTEAENYKKYKATFTVGDKDWNFTVFTPFTKKDGTPKKGVHPKDLEEGKYYKISYTEYQSEAMTYPSKTAVSFFESSEEQAQTEAKESQDVAFNLEEGIVKDLVDTYFKMVNKEDRHVNHFIGTIFRSLNQELCEPLVEKFEELNKE